MNHARTVTRYACLVGLVAGLLAPVSSLAQQSSTGPAATTITRVASAGTSGSDILARVTANTQPQAIGSRIYWTQQVPVSRETLRVGALAAMRRGVMHPGLQLAIFAAGYIWSQEEGVQVPDDDAPIYESIDAPEGQSFILRNTSQRFPSTGAVCHAAIKQFGDSHEFRTRAINYLGNNSYECRYHMLGSNGWINSSNRRYADLSTNSPNTPTDYTGPSNGFVPATESDLEHLDGHLPESIVDDLWSDNTASEEWEQIIEDFWANDPALSGQPKPSSSGNAPPEVSREVAKRAANIDAQTKGEDKPFPGSSGGGLPPEDEMLDRWDEPPPDFPGVDDPVWNVEVIEDLPDYDSGLSGGHCPAPTVVNVPLYGSITIEWYPICDFASMISGAVKALGLLMGLFIVLGRK
ncbi:hypothetical protein IEI94_12110 [Halomonas sp. ML-15]|uniref:virulence factor TspB C-terminal domain-related protein n=1 Tax=Halomonas sp. ML-15 TaxID=2773305 RepID=UPI0017477B7C|nr:virulence factor TspB C-terminal domain-related protein [Halomonas sp. ML-15]MBD3896595.1 hypothetical protein [Halomonas sp. ML-15]